MSEALDHWVPDYSVRTYHRREATVDQAALWRAATTIRLADTRRLGKLVSWRIPDVHPSQTYHELFRAYPFTVLEETDDLLVSGLCGKIWTLARDYPRLADADAFADWDERGTVRVAFAHWAREREDGTSELCSEARVHAVDTTARLRLKAIWALLGPFERLVGAEPLELAVSRATGAT
ncbi:hypothetical protein OM076_39140 [Solirubrobacter ginsenosidimutans]|uniref:Uncharacterized protein n=1 Tax=Solirubrobacter ginsenosidimutans TaxID=490573 RepID=A0A9X3N177_9ACTN|nr:hypothetical protein [Solirubrobacter ginsenosidimutans]MDA0166347.1 hypothetical protein [Solirubrobacter ginsenosidimutans]